MENDLKNNFSGMKCKTLRDNLVKLQKWRKMGRTGITRKSAQFMHAGLKDRLATCLKKDAGLGEMMEIDEAAKCLDKAGVRFDAKVRLRKTLDNFANESLDEVSIFKHISLSLLKMSARKPSHDSNLTGVRIKCVSIQ